MFLKGKRIVVSVALVIALVFSYATVALAATPAEDEPRAEAQNGQWLDSEAAQIAKLVNEQRVANGLPALTWHTDLARGAKIRAKEIVERFEHIRPDGSDGLSVSKYANGENIAHGYGASTTPAAVMDAWMKSKAHKENILYSGYKSIGIGCYTVNGKKYWVLLFSITEGGTVPGQVAVKSVKLNRTVVTILPNAKFKLNATITPSNATNKAVSWKSGNTAIAKVTSEGLVKGLKKGRVTITATTQSGKKVAKCVVFVGAKVSGVSLSKEKLRVKAGNTVALSATVSPSNAADKFVTWKSSNSAIAKVDQKGKVTAVKPGKVTIQVITRDVRKKASCTVTVVK